MDIEDLVPCPKNMVIDREMIHKNIDVYKKIVQNLYDFCNENKSRKHLKLNFGKYLSTFVKRKDGLTIKKVYLVYVYKIMIGDKEIENDQKLSMNR